MEVAEDIYCGPYQLALSIFTHLCQDLLMQDLHDELDQHLVRAGLCSTRHLGRSNPGVEHIPGPLLV